MNPFEPPARAYYKKAKHKGTVLLCFATLYGVLRKGSVVVESEKFHGNRSFMIPGNPDENRYVAQTLHISGSAGDVFTFGSWAKADACPSQTQGDGSIVCVWNINRRCNGSCFSGIKYSYWCNNCCRKCAWINPAQTSDKYVIDQGTVL